MWHRQCLFKDNIAGVSQVASGVDKDAKNRRERWIVTKEEDINRSRLKLLLVLAWCNHSAGAAKDTQHM